MSGIAVRTFVTEPRMRAIAGKTYATHVETGAPRTAVKTVATREKIGAISVKIAGIALKTGSIGIPNFAIG
jgi:hypothetical protein